MDSFAAETTTADSFGPSWVEALRSSLAREMQRKLDQTVPHRVARYAFFAASFLIFWIRIFAVQGFYIVAYGLGIFILHLFIGVLSPQEDFALDGPTLPTSDADEFKPFQRRLPEFKFWYSATKATLISLLCTFFPFLDIPVFWPILLIYFFVLVYATMKRQIQHMIKHRYIPFDLGRKKTYRASKNASSTDPRPASAPQDRVVLKKYTKQ